MSLCSSINHNWNMFKLNDFSLFYQYTMFFTDQSGNALEFKVSRYCL